MSRAHVRAIAVLAIAACTPASGAYAHCFVGNRFFPATLNVDDPCVADELSLPTVSSAWNGDDPSAHEVEFSGELSKKITDSFGISLEGAWQHIQQRNGESAAGFDNLGTSFKYQFLSDPSREFVMSASLDVDWGGTGSKEIDSEPFTTLTPTLFIGQGLGLLPEELKYLRPLAVTLQVGYSVPTASTTTEDGTVGNNPQSIVYGGSIQYSMPYLKSAVEDRGLPDFVNRLIPVVEWNLATETENFDGEVRTTGTVNPGLIYVGDKFQLSSEAIIPINRASGDGVGAMGQVHFYLDDILPDTYGQPLFGGLTDRESK